MFTIKTYFSTVSDCYLEADTYANNKHIAIEVFSESEGPYASLTVNLDTTKKYPKNYGYVDTNNFPEAEYVINKLGIGEDTGLFGFSGMCIYPLYKFDLEKIKQYEA